MVGAEKLRLKPTTRLRDLVDATLTQLRAKSPAENSNEFDVHDLHLSIFDISWWAENWVGLSYGRSSEAV
jgi:hypothetical protein